MHDIIELVYFLDQHHIKLFIKPTKKQASSNKMAMLYFAILDGSVKDDMDAMKLLYPDGASDATYRKLKSQFRDKLLDGVMTFNGVQPHFTEYQNDFYESQRSLFLVKILSSHTAHNSAIFLANKVLKKALQYQFTLLAIDIISQCSTCSSSDIILSPVDLLYQFPDVRARYRDSSELCESYGYWDI
jgi:hypothetical protein